MNPELKKNLSSGDHWFRALYVILFLLFAKVAGFLVALVAVIQIIFSLVTGEYNRQLLRFGDSLAQYLSAVFVFVVGKTEEKPFPFADWPVSDIPVEVEPKQTPEKAEQAAKDSEPVEQPTAEEPPVEVIVAKADADSAEVGSDPKQQEPSEPGDELSTSEKSEDKKDDSDNADSNEKPKV